MKRNYFSLFIFAIALSFWGCKGAGVNLFSIQDDIALGKQVSQQIESDTKQFPILPERGNEKVYKYVRGLKDKILRTGKITYRTEFPWSVKIIDDDKTLNAFATPGGYIYVYTGLIKFLDSEDQLAGVMGHEMAHADRRHSTRQLTKQYGIQALASIATGNKDPGMLEQIALGLVSLRFSRAHELEADEYSVIYLCPTSYNAKGAAGFFEKMQGQSRTPAFLSTHPDPGNRVQEITKKAQELNCSGRKTNSGEYNRIKKML